MSGPCRATMRPLAPFLPLLAGLALLASCAAPRAAEAPTPVALPAPAPSPPGDLDPEARLAWWRDRLPALPPDARSEALLATADLQLELDRPGGARLDAYEALGGDLSLEEAAWAERAIGLSWLLEGEPDLGVPHLRKALPGLEAPAAEEVAWVLGELGAAPPAAGGPEVAARMRPFLEAAGVTGPQAVAASAPRSGFADVPRSAWGAAPLRANHDPMERPWRITVHHTAEPIADDSLPTALREVRDIQRTHLAKGWADVGYHFLIDPAGRVIEGRPLTAQGAHAGNSELNRGNVGIALLGNFVAQPSRGAAYAPAQHPTPAQLAALRRLVRALMAAYDITPDHVYPHDAFRDTACPGPELEAWVRSFRRGG